MSNSPRNGRESAKTVSVDDLHVSAPWGSTTMEIYLGPKMVSNSPRNGLESAKTASVDDQNINAHQGSLIVEITPGPQNSE